MPRYYIKTREMSNYWQIENGELKRYPLNTRLEEVYLDILGTGYDGIMKQVKLYLEKGESLICYLPFKPTNHFYLTDTDDLFDGRFNS
jgi:hypothetical protein